tara:strand:- start:163 stop:516 length:354 start_codon:yes stop_codon:yes gene_type:complete
MSKYTVTKNKYSVDIIRNSDNHAKGFMCSKVFNEVDLLYVDKQTDAFGGTIEADVLPEGKKFGDVKVAGRGWVQEDWDWDVELQNAFGEVDADLKKELTDYFTSDMKASYLADQKGS